MYNLDATKLKCTEEGMVIPDEKMADRVQELIGDKVNFLEGVDENVSVMNDLIITDLPDQGEPADFAHPALEFLITTFFYGKANSVGVVFRGEKDFKQVPNAMIGLAAVVVRFTNYD